MIDTNGMRERINPKNILSGKRIWGFKTRNFFEGLVMAGIVGICIYQVPFVPKVKWIVIICICLCVLIGNAIGIKDQPVTQTIKNFLSYRKHLKTYSYRRLQNGKTKYEPVIVNGKVRTIKQNRSTEKFKNLVGK